MALDPLVTDVGVLVDIGDGILRRVSTSAKSDGDILQVDASDPVGVSFQPASAAAVSASKLSDYTMYGEDSGSGVTELSMQMDAGTLGISQGVPVPSTMTATIVAASWLSDNVPAGNWTATLWRRPHGGVWGAAATFPVLTS